MSELLRLTRGDSAVMASIEARAARSTAILRPVGDCARMPEMLPRSDGLIDIRRAISGGRQGMKIMPR